MEGGRRKLFDWYAVPVAIETDIITTMKIRVRAEWATGVVIRSSC